MKKNVTYTLTMNSVFPMRNYTGTLTFCMEGGRTRKFTFELSNILELEAGAVIREKGEIFVSIESGNALDMTTAADHLTDAQYFILDIVMGIGHMLAEKMEEPPILKQKAGKKLATLLSTKKVSEAKFYHSGTFEFTNESLVTELL